MPRQPPVPLQAVERENWCLLLNLATEKEQMGGKYLHQATL